MEQQITSFTGEYRWLSNFWPSIVTRSVRDFDNDRELIVTFPTVEHAYQSAKTRNVSLILDIRDASTPGKAKKLGSKLPLPPSWSMTKILVMEDLLRQKFSIPELRNRLIETGNATLIEGNHWGDTFWGMVNINDQWVGDNNLGKLLMKIRDEIVIERNQ